MYLLNMAAKIAQGGDKKKSYLLAAVIKRKDGAIVIAENIITKEQNPQAHAEYRALRKADLGCELYVARVLRKNGQWAMARPCKHCQAIIRNKGVRRVYYTIGPNEFGVWNVYKNKLP